MKVWLQHSDLSHLDLPNGEMEYALNQLVSFDWRTELDYEESATENNLECCPAGMGFVAENGDILHVMPSRNCVSHYHFHYGIGEKKTKRFLFFFKYIESEGGDFTESRRNIPDQQQRELIAHHYAGYQEEVLNILREFGEQW